MTPANRTDPEWLAAEILSLETRLGIWSARLAECRAAQAELHQPEHPAKTKTKQPKKDN